MIRERCSCGAEIETDEQHALRLVNEWRKNHRHTEPQPEQHDAVITSNLDTQRSDPREPELHIGFRPDPFDDE